MNSYIILIEDVLSFLFRRTSKLIVYFVLIFLISLVAISTYKCVTSDGEVQYCYVRYDGHVTVDDRELRSYSLIGQRAWRRDRVISSELNSLLEVKEEADLINCALM